VVKYYSTSFRQCLSVVSKTTISNSEAFFDSFARNTIRRAPYKDCLVLSVVGEAKLITEVKKDKNVFLISRAN